MDGREEWSFNVDAYTARLIGRENVARLEGAIMELVKNAYDADANCFCIYYSLRLNSLFLIDNGTGMSRDTIRDYWMTIGNSSKKEHYLSAKKRIQTGAKGIGRFALDRIADHSDMLTRQNGQGITWSVNTAHLCAGACLDEALTEKKNWHIEHWQIIAVFLGVYDFVAVCAAYFLALFVRFHFVTSQPSKNGLVLA